MKNKVNSLGQTATILSQRPPQPPMVQPMLCHGKTRRDNTFLAVLDHWCNFGN